MLEWGSKTAGLTEFVLDGQTVGHVDPATFRERAEVDIRGQRWLFSKQSGELLGQRADEPTPRFRARRPSILRQGWEASLDETTYVIEPAGFFSTTYRVLRDGAEIGTSRRAGLLSSRPTLDVPAATPIEHQVFLLWVAFIMRRRAAASASSGGAGGGG